MTRACLLLLAAWIAAGPVNDLPADEGWWPSFRGRAASGIGDGFDVPTDWNAADGTGVLWKTAIPGLGHSSPIAWGDRVYVTSAVPAEGTTSFARGLVDTSASAGDRAPHEWRLFALDRVSGRILWSRVAASGVPATDRHAKATHANPTPATDGRYIAASFGSEGLFVYDSSGTLKWSKALGTLDGGWTPAPGTMWGFGSSPVIHDGLVVVQCDTQSASFLAAFDVETGHERWRVARGEDTSWSTPTIAIEDSGAVVLTSGTSKHRAYDLATGRELWSVGDGLDVKIPTPLAADGMYLFGGGSAHDARTFYAVRAGARGALDAANGLAWTSDASPHVPTPLAYRDRLYVISDAGILTTYDLASGVRQGRCRIAAGAFMASPVAADGRVFFTSEDGDVYVIAAGDACQRVSTNPIGEPVVATPALAPGQFIVRTTGHVMAFGGRPALSATQTPARALPMVITGTELVQAMSAARPLVIQAGLASLYTEGHLPGAHLTRHDDVVDPSAADMHGVPQPSGIKRYLDRLGASDDRPIVLYGAPMDVAWLYVAFDRAGLAARVSVLDGGLPAWRAAGGAVEIAAPPPASTGNISVRPRDGVIVDTAFMRGAALVPAVAIIDARSAREWDEEGHIAGAARVDWAGATLGTRTWWALPDRAALERMFSAAGLKPGQQVVAYCAIGMRASVIYFVARLLGYEARLYDDSWAGWTAGANPIAR